MFECNFTNESLDGGAVWIWETGELIGLKNCFFSLCHATTGFGGALNHYLSNYKENSYPIRYCFFNKNTAPYGNDAYLVLSDTFKGAPFLHCFSTTTTNRLAYWDGSSNRFYGSEIQNNWLLLVIIIY